MAKEVFKNIHGNEYCTPDNLFQTLNEEFNFVCDLACTKGNKKVRAGIYRPQNDSLKFPWHTVQGWLWLNPPYSPLKPWIQKAQAENKLGAKIVVLVPPILSTRYFSEWLPTEIRFILGRVPFLLDGVPMKSNTSDSCLLIYDTPKTRKPLRIKYIERSSLLFPDSALL